MMDYRLMDYSLIEERIRKWGTFKLSKHAKKRLNDRKISIQDISNTLADPIVIRHECEYKKGQMRIKYTLQGTKEEEPYGVVVSFDRRGGVIVVTMMYFDDGWSLNEEGIFLKESVS